MRARKLSSAVPQDLANSWHGHQSTDPKMAPAHRNGQDFGCQFQVRAPEDFNIWALAHPYKQSTIAMPRATRWPEWTSPTAAWVTRLASTIPKLRQPQTSRGDFPGHTADIGRPTAIKQLVWAPRVRRDAGNPLAIKRLDPPSEKY